MNEGALLIAASVIVVAVAVFFTLVTAPQRAAFDQRGIRTQAEITNLRTSRVGGVIFNSNAYNVDYTYLAAVPGLEKVRQGGTHQIAESTFSQLKVGNSIEILYLPEQPAVSRPATAYLDRAIERSKARSCLTYAGSVALGFLIVGIVLSVAGPTTPIPTDQVSAPVRAELTELHAALDSRIPGWQQTATSHQVRISAQDAGFSSSSQMHEVYYGACKARNVDHFYVYVIRTLSTGKPSDSTWFGQAYAYTPGIAKAADCLPEGWSAISDDPVEGDWHLVLFSYPAQIPFFRLTETAQPREGR